MVYIYIFFFYTVTEGLRARVVTRHHRSSHAREVPRSSPASTLHFFIPFQRPGFDEKTYLGKQQPVETAPVKQNKASLKTSLPEPTPAAVITVTEPASSGKNSPSIASPVCDTSSSISATSKSEALFRCEECRRVFNPGQTAVVLNDLDKVL
jgi:hypothetical protein